MYDHSILLAAARDGNEAALHDLLERAQCFIGRTAELLNAANSQGYAALHLAAHSGHEGCLRLIVAVDAALDAGGAGEKDDTALIASCRAGHAVCARILIEAGADVNKCNRGGSGGTALAIACNKGHVECVRVCLDGGADVDLPAEDGITPFQIACQHGHIDCACLCIEAGANVDAVILAKSKPPARHWAARSHDRGEVAAEAARRRTEMNKLFETRKHLAATKIQARWRGGCGRTASARQYAALAERARLAQQFDVLIQQASAHRISYYINMDHR